MVIFLCLCQRFSVTCVDGFWSGVDVAQEETQQRQRQRHRGDLFRNRVDFWKSGWRKWDMTNYYNIY